MKNFFKKYKKLKEENSLFDTIDFVVKALPVVFIIKTFGFGLYQVPTCSMESTMLVGERFLALKGPFAGSLKRGDIVSFNDPVYSYSENPFDYFYEKYLSLSVKSWTKRIIGIPGDHLRGVIENGSPVVYLNGEKLNEPYVNNHPIMLLYREKAEGVLVHRTYDPSKDLDNQPFYRMNKVEMVRAKQIVGNSEKSILYPDEPAFNSKGKSLDEFDIKLKDNEYWVMGDNRKGSYDSRDWGPLNGNLIHGKIYFRIWSSDSEESWWILDLIKHPIDFWKRLRWSRCLQLVH